MAHKKAGGSSRNGRDSESKRLGVKLFGGQNGARRQHHRASARHQVAPGRQRRPGQGPYAFCAYRRPSHVPRRQAWPQIRPRHADLRKRRNRNGQKGTVPSRGGPDWILQGSRPKREKGSPGRGLPFFIAFSRNCHGPPLGARARRRRDVRENAKIAAEAGFPGGCPGACRCDCRRGDRAQSGDRRLGPIRMRDAEAFLVSPARSGTAVASHLRADRRRAAADRFVRPRPTAVGRGRDGLLDRPFLLGPRLRDRGVHGADRHCADAWACQPRRLALHRQSRLRRECSTSSASKRSGSIAPRMSCARGEEVPARLMRLRLTAGRTSRRMRRWRPRPPASPFASALRQSRRSAHMHSSRSRSSSFQG